MLYHCWPARRRINATRRAQFSLCTPKHSRVHHASPSGPLHPRVLHARLCPLDMAARVAPRGCCACCIMAPWTGYLCRRSHDCLPVPSPQRCSLPTSRGPHETGRRRLLPLSLVAGGAQWMAVPYTHYTYIDTHTGTDSAPNVTGRRRRGLFHAFT